MTFKKEKGICQSSMTTRPPTFERLSIAKKKNVQTPLAPIINRLGDRGPHVQIDSSIDTKKKESTSRASIWCRIKHIDVESCHGKEFLCEVKRHDVILTNPEKEDSGQGKCEISCHHITILEELEIETPEEGAEDAPQSLEDGG
ncbi:gypsy-like retrotransposase [Cucumis melo var. makuwa]|uniref:Gypsy-like retrotransposase n=1 Tax=Cucumis melo var. makuwa TaxID=1194695 RepID=A0A5D3BJ98_CUCMM|nr:gypsy-like retrotransposase [Cucumis melo var. makuwa]TYJ98781.1 gypsy-like retrotransposase [Cucumis melo var. makuwa]